MVQLYNVITIPDEFEKHFQRGIDKINAYTVEPQLSEPPLSEPSVIQMLL